MTDVLIIGGGIIGLATAFELAIAGAEVTILERGSCGQGATRAAAGMLAPQAEKLSGALLDLALRSRQLYPDWITKLEHLTGMDSGFWACGILCPYFNSIWIWRQNLHKHPHFQSCQQIQARQQGLNFNIAGGLWFPEDAQVDNRRLAEMLTVAVKLQGVKIVENVNVNRIATAQNQVTHLETNHGDLQGDRYLLATGAWTKALMPLPITPTKGQMLSVFDRDRNLQTILYAPEAYIIPRQDGRIIIGATVEDVDFTPGNTAKGIRNLLNGAIKVYPAIADLVIQETWWGFRPNAPDEMPLLGASDYSNLFLATGHYRNGILLAPITAQILTGLIQDSQSK